MLLNSVDIKCYLEYLSSNFSIQHRNLNLIHLHVTMMVYIICSKANFLFEDSKALPYLKCREHFKATSISFASFSAFTLDV